MTTMFNHGGGCCGVFHIAGFRGSVEVAQAHLRLTLDTIQQNQRMAGQRLHEAILTEHQDPIYGQLLTDAGFRKTLSFVNGNTNNRLYVYYKHDDLTVYEPNAEAPVTPPPAEPPHVFTEGERVEFTLPSRTGERAQGTVRGVNGSGTVRVLWDVGASSTHGPRALRPLHHLSRHSRHARQGPAAEPRPELRIIETEYYAQLRDGSRKGLYNSEEGVRRRFPRCRTFLRREIMSDGSSVWTEL